MGANGNAPNAAQMNGMPQDYPPYNGINFNSFNNSINNGTMPLFLFFYKVINLSFM